ncbi:MAG: hypothetical protein E6G56_04340 [Actinobacteria bacterium]|nr:MAG: hypothetical protein E6G56_04340 [Actinomycetota bacterium]
MGRAYLTRFAPPLVLLVAGLLVLARAGGEAVGTAVGLGLVGLAGVWLVSAVFYEVGRSEDRARAAERPPTRTAGDRRRSRWTRRP